MKLHAFVLGLFAIVMMSFAAAQPAFAQDKVLKASDITANLFPDHVYFKGQTAPSQIRNSGGVKFAEGNYFLAAMVDTSGYTSGVREKYQAYLITDVPLEIGGQRLAAGAYGIGWIAGQKFIVQDLGGHDVFTVDSKHDAEMKRPMPLQVVAGPSARTYLLYGGRDSVELKRAQ
ncbi:MAG: hypothetical protein WA823_07690 [Candidatus Acidiferrales bacterium]